jgi:Zn-finger protein
MSYKFFSNKACEYYPCHDIEEDINCMFCYCPLYFLDCPGNYTETYRGLKDCSICVYPHKKESWDYIIAFLSL